VQRTLQRACLSLSVDIGCCSCPRPSLSLSQTKSDISSQAAAAFVCNWHKVLFSITIYPSTAANVRGMRIIRPVVAMLLLIALLAVPSSAGPDSQGKQCFAGYALLRNYPDYAATQLGLCGTGTQQWD
jgi:hypothetical protein